MAMTYGMLCIDCEEVGARHDSHFCSASCKDRWMARMDGPVSCNGGEEMRGCFAEEDTVKEALAAGWVGINPDPEGSTWNFLGTCPECTEPASRLPPILPDDDPRNKPRTVAQANAEKPHA